MKLISEEIQNAEYLVEETNGKKDYKAYRAYKAHKTTRLMKNASQPVAHEGPADNEKYGTHIQ